MRNVDGFWTKVEILYRNMSHEDCADSLESLLNVITPRLTECHWFARNLNPGTDIIECLLLRVYFELDGLFEIDCKCLLQRTV